MIRALRQTRESSTLSKPNVDPFSSKSQEVPTPSGCPSSVSSHAQTVKTFKVPEDVKNTNEQEVRILVIDNGASVPFPPFTCLKMSCSRLENSSAFRKEKKYGHVFDLICSTSTGRWITLMLRRLGMTVRQSIRAYEQIVQNVFSKDASLSTEGYTYSADWLEDVFH
ncbi:hypothetical protein BT69DRAFT_1329317 [Atractiella rhizophila]|nr:hypothetical protein BT69DRAFT_1329317 [Atractiella rhizophila]